jgi:hypothetical protein
VTAAAAPEPEPEPDMQSLWRALLKRHARALERLDMTNADINRSEMKEQVRTFT